MSPPGRGSARARCPGNLAGACISVAQEEHARVERVWRVCGEGLWTLQAQRRIPRLKQRSCTKTFWCEGGCLRNRSQQGERHGVRGGSDGGGWRKFAAVACVHELPRTCERSGHSRRTLSGRPNSDGAAGALTKISSGCVARGGPAAMGAAACNGGGYEYCCPGAGAGWPGAPYAAVAYAACELFGGYGAGIVAGVAAGGG
eukprot:364183-Chlamydomonas_euryale.AAC.17